MGYPFQRDRGDRLFLYRAIPLTFPLLQVSAMPHYRAHASRTKSKDPLSGEIAFRHERPPFRPLRSKLVLGPTGHTLS